MPDDTHRALDVLLVSDDPELGTDFSSVLPQGSRSRNVRDAREAWSALGERIPDVVVVEIRSGSAGGFGLARDMSHKADLKDVPVVMLLERSQDTWLADQAGARATIVEPYEPRTIASRLEEILAAREGVPGPS